jgi:hypothetical protein
VSNYKQTRFGGFLFVVVLCSVRPVISRKRNGTLPDVMSAAEMNRQRRRRGQ